MADINVERKQRNLLPWLIGLVVLALLVWLLASMLDRDDEEVADRPTVEAPATTSP